TRSAVGAKPTSVALPTRVRGRMGRIAPTAGDSFDADKPVKSEDGVSTIFATSNNFPPLASPQKMKGTSVVPGNAFATVAQKPSSRSSVETEPFLTPRIATLPLPPSFSPIRFAATTPPLRLSVETYDR